MGTRKRISGKFLINNRIETKDSLLKINEKVLSAIQEYIEWSKFSEKSNKIVGQFAFEYGAIEYYIEYVNEAILIRFENQVISLQKKVFNDDGTVSLEKEIPKEFLKIVKTAFDELNGKDGKIVYEEEGLPDIILTKLE